MTETIRRIEVKWWPSTEPLPAPKKFIRRVNRQNVEPAPQMFSEVVELPGELRTSSPTPIVATQQPYVPSAGFLDADAIDEFLLSDAFTQICEHGLDLASCCSSPKATKPMKDSIIF
mmetsp:Transcript_62056/g.166517  ORF Transcript_62056/g.166517 Transcript_62056/m.166517 type:complete len:117 (+) Transcript_62056:3-353(+)